MAKLNRFGVWCSLLIGLVAVGARADDRQNADELPPPTNFPKGLWTAQLTGGYYGEIQSRFHKVNPYTAGFSYYLRDGLGLGVDVVGYKLDERGGFDDAGAAGLNLTLRHHVYERGDFSLFLDAVLGCVYADDEFPPGGTRFNYTEQAGVGATYRIRDNVYFIGAARFMHISNAYIHGRDQNPGVNALGGYVGLLFKF
jgi:hypothetical protein